jgi:diguanylate cyclase (GGDEF)-like protein
MNAKRAVPRAEAADDPLEETRRLLQEGEAADNPLAPELARCLDSYEKLLRRFHKTVSISDRYQSQLMELKVKLEVSASTDLLTGLPNRRKLMELLEAELSRVERHQGGFSILIADLDHFKAINDGHGHLAGDLLLQNIADTLRRGLRAEDSCGRWGGEEFLILLPETDRTQACLVAEKLVAAVGRAAVDWEGKRLSVTLSVGVAAWRPGLSLDDCLRLADDALYGAKRQGRDRVSAAM